MDNFNEKKDNAVTLAAPPYGLWLVAVPNARTHAAQLPITSVIQNLFFEHGLSNFHSEVTHPHTKKCAVP